MEENAEIDTRISTINVLNDDCLRLIFQYLPIVEKIKVERGTLNTDQMDNAIFIFHSLISFFLQEVLHPKLRQG